MSRDCPLEYTDAWKIGSEVRKFILGKYDFYIYFWLFPFFVPVLNIPFTYRCNVKIIYCVKKWWNY